MTRVKEVIDAWFDSGAMPFAQHHYPFENQEFFNDTYPAQFISEAVDQTRGWFYSLLAISTALWGRNSYENCIVLGHVLDKNGIKMSKHIGNIVAPMPVIEEEGADAVRWHFYTSSQPWLPTRFSQEQVGETRRKFIGTLWNVYSFYVLYAELDQFDPHKHQDAVSDHVMDRWILSRLNTLIKTVGDRLDNYDITGAALAIEDFTDVLSNWYVRRNRSRFWSEELTGDKINAYNTLYKVLTTLANVAAPFVPFVTEEIYQNLVQDLDPEAKESIHLTSWPSFDESQIDQELEEEMNITYSLVRLGRSARNQAVVKNRQPLQMMLVSEKKLPEYYGDIIKDELNIKEVQLGADLSKYVNFEIKPNLPILGRSHGKQIPAIRKAIAEMNQMELAQNIMAGKDVYITLGEEDIALNQDNLLVHMQGLEGFAFAGEGERGVVLDTTITPELKQEGYVREVISKVQNLRKETGLEVSDRIELFLSGNELIESVIKSSEDFVKGETLADTIEYGRELETEEININGEKVRLSLKKLV